MRVGLADRLELAGPTLRQVPFLVLEDQQLEMPHPVGYHIEAIMRPGFDCSVMTRCYRYRRKSLW